jgi:hypothetical protein
MLIARVGGAEMTRTQSHTLGLAVGTFLAAWHAAWALLVLFGGAQTLLDFVFRVHMISQPFTVMPFSFGSATTLVLFTGVVGYVFGWFIGFMINLCVPEFRRVNVTEPQPSKA